MPIKPSETERCPHCRIAVRFDQVSLIAPSGSGLGTVNPITYRTPGGYDLSVNAAGCPACGRPILTAVSATVQVGHAPKVENIQLWPDSAARPLPLEVEAESPNLAADFREAVTVYPKSKKASAALSRRCLQQVLKTKAGAKKKDLADQIEETLPLLPTQLAQNVDAIRHVGNFATHPMKSLSTGEIVDVEEGEAEWLLDVLEDLFDFFYVAPARSAMRRDALNQKLATLGKPPLKK